MRFIMITTVAASVAVAIAMPALDKHEPLCRSNTASNAVCCATVILGILGLDCDTPTTSPKDIPDFKKICAATGQQAMCCTLSVANQAALCSPPV